MNLRTRAVLLGTALPVLLLGAAAVLVQSWMPRLPDPVALHWGLDGPDRFGAPGELLLPFAILTAVLCLPLMIASPLVRGEARRGVVGMSAGLATLVAGIAVGTTAIQLDAVDATALPSPGAATGLSLLAAIAVGILAAWAAGRGLAAPTQEEIPGDAARLSLPDGAAAVWSRPLPSIPLLVPVIVIALLVGMGVTFGVLTGDWWLLLPMVVTSAVLLGTFGWRVTVDRTGLTVRSTLGWPRYRVPANEIVRADVTQVRPFADFGGWGFRLGRGGAVGFVTRTGEAVSVERTEGRRCVVTVDDAARAAALLNTLAERSRTVGTP